MKIWLDDVRDAPDDWVWVKSCDAAIDALTMNAGRVTDISLDHDLGIVDDGLAFDTDAQTGYDVACWLERQAVDGNWMHVPDNLFVHSANPVGRKNIQAAIDSIKRMRNDIR